MYKIDSSLRQFTHALLKGQSVVVNARGEWEAESPYRKCLRQIFGREASRLTEVAHAFGALLDSLEAIPIRFSESLGLPAQLRDFSGYIRAGEAILSQLAAYQAPFATAAYRALKMRIVALKYRIERTNGGLNPQAPRFDLQMRLEADAKRWKETLSVGAEKKLCLDEELAIEEICRFPEFVEHLLDDSALRDQFFSHSLRDKIPAALFVEYPALCRKLAENGLNGRIGRMGGSKVLKIVKECVGRHLKEKIVTLPFEGRAVNILDDNLSVEFQGGYVLTLAQVFEIFKSKKLRAGNLEFMHDGIINWNIQKWGRWNSVEQKYETVDLTKEGWWKQLPLFETLTAQEAKERYGAEADGVNWVATAAATRGRASLDVELTHAYLELAVPIGNSCYAVFDFGKEANEYPATYVDMLQMVCTTVHATIAYPDENVFYTHREHAHHPFFLAPAEGLKLMDAIRKDMISSKGFNFVYQIESENCAKWVHEKIEAAIGAHTVPNLFVMSIFHTEALSVLGKIISFCKLFPKPWRIKALTFFHLPLGAFKGHWIVENGTLVWRALTHHPFWETGTIYLPCFLHKQKELGLLSAGKNILENIFERKERDRPVPRGPSRGRLKDPAGWDPGQKNKEKILSCLNLAICGFLRFCGAHLFSHKERFMWIPKFFSSGMEFAPL